MLSCVLCTSFLQGFAFHTDRVNKERPLVVLSLFRPIEFLKKDSSVMSENGTSQRKGEIADLSDVGRARSRHVNPGHQRRSTRSLSRTKSRKLRNAPMLFSIRNEDCDFRPVFFATPNWVDEQDSRLSLPPIARRKQQECQGFFLSNPKGRAADKKHLTSGHQYSRPRIRTNKILSLTSC